MFWRVTRYLKNKYVLIAILVLLLCLAVVLVYYSKKVSSVTADNFKVLPYAPLIDKKIDRDFAAELLFNNQPNQKPFTPLLVDEIKKAKSSIDLAMYSIDSNVLKDELYAAAKRGVNVNIVLSNNKKNQHHHLFADAPANVKTYDLGGDGDVNYNLMHHKFVIFDDGLPSQKLFTGSLNWTDLQELFDPSFVMATTDEAVVAVYSEEFKRLLVGKTGKLKLGVDGYRPWAANLNYNNGRVELWWSPGVREHIVKQRILDLVYSASSTIDAMVWQLSDRDIVNAFYKKANEGVKIRLIVDDFNAWNEVSKVGELVTSSLTNNNIEVVDDVARTLDFTNHILPNLSAKNKDFNSFFHHHALIVDGQTLMAGTNNWSYSANFKNDESALVTTVKNLVSEYQKTFDFHYQHLRSQKLTARLENNRVIVSPLDGHKNARLVIVGEAKSNSIAPIVCYEQKSEQKEMSWPVSSECQDKVLNVFMLNDVGEVLGNVLLGLFI
jgi:phosphatidylserine/phosphatidylglycerophosphate/cardiolipin synthase-like enzyme